MSKLGRDADPRSGEERIIKTESSRGREGEGCLYKTDQKNAETTRAN